MWSVVWAAFIPYVIYSGIMFVLNYQNKAKLRATLNNDEEKVLEMLSKFKLK